ncbi:MAG TPA: hypothetical protein VK874_13080 [Gaiellaceae bacterium]|nr:hypothetical protein [Gaiellaceae bacterium]
MAAQLDITYADPGSVDALRERIQRLVGERQTLRAAAADREALERNRLEICRLQHELSLALVAAFQPAPA